MRFSRFTLVCAAALTLLGCSRDSKQQDPSEAAKSQSIVPNNGIAMSKEELATKADIPIYPGAEVPEGQSKVTPATTETDYEINMVTPDSLDKVTQFYKEKLHLDRQGSSSSADMMGMTPKGELAHIKVEAKNGKTYIKAVSKDEKRAE